MHLQDLRDRLRAHGAKPCHEEHMLRAWTHARPLDSGPRVATDYLPSTVRHALPALTAAFGDVARVRSQHLAADGSIRLLVELADGQSVETVLLPRDGVCVSTQVGCAVGCVFCMTGRNGLQRHLGSAEIVAQVVLARALRSVSKVVFMGMGEPAHNLDAVLEAIDLLGTEGAIGYKNLVLSTVGDRRVFECLPRRRIKPALALSLHTTFADDPPATAAARAADRSRRARGGSRALRARHALPHPVSMDAAARHQRQRRRDRGDRAPAARQVRGDEPHPVQHGRRRLVRAPRRSARHRDGHARSTAAAS